MNGGRTIVWPVADNVTFGDPGTVYVAEYDTRTGAARVIPGLTFTSLSTSAGWLPRIAADRSRPVFFVIDPQMAVHRIENGVRTVIATLPPLDGGSLYAEVRDRRLFVWRRMFGAEADTEELFILDGRTGAIERTVSALTEYVVHISSDGRRVYLGSSNRGLRVVEAETWIELASRAFSVLPGFESIPFIQFADETRNIVTLADPGIRSLHLAGLNATTLEDLGVLDTGTPITDRVVRGYAHAGGQAPLFLLSRLIAPGYADQCEINQPRLEVVSGRTGRFVAQMSLGDECPLLVPLSPPLPPTGLAASVNGSDVTLAWTAPLDATSFDLEAGSAPGLKNLVVQRLGRETTLDIPNVPRGTYYVRIRGVNEQGIGASSADVRVVVP